MKKGLIVFALSFIAIFTCSDRTYAGFWENLYNGYDQLTSLPKEVTKLQENYDKTMSELSRTKENVNAFQAKNEELFEQNQKFMTQNENLIEQNQHLIKQNQELSLVVNELKKSEKEREQTKSKAIKMVWTVAILVVGYFILIRIIRFFMRLSSRRIKKEDVN